MVFFISLPPGFRGSGPSLALTARRPPLGTSCPPGGSGKGAKRTSAARRRFGPRPSSTLAGRNDRLHRGRSFQTSSMCSERPLWVAKVLKRQMAAATFDGDLGQREPFERSDGGRS
jgi:hypothetical protein